MENFPTEVLDHICSFLDFSDLRNLRCVCRSFRDYFKVSYPFAKRLVTDLYGLKDYNSILYDEAYSADLSLLSSFEKVPLHSNNNSKAAADCSTIRASKWQKVLSNYRQIQKNIRNGHYQIWRFTVDESNDFLFQLTREALSSLSSFYKSFLDDSPVNMGNMAFSLDWNGHYAVIIVHREGRYSDIYVWKTKGKPSFMYKVTREGAAINCKSFAIWENFLIVAPEKPSKTNLITIHDIDNNLIPLGIVKKKSLEGDLDNTRHHGEATNVIVEQFVEVLSGGKVVTLIWHQRKYLLHIIDIKSLRIEKEVALWEGLALDFEFNYHVEHRPYYRSSIVINFGRQQRRYGNVSSSEEELSANHNLPINFYLLSIDIYDSAVVHLYPGNAVSCFGMDITDEGHILALINRFHSSSQGKAAIGLYRNGDLPDLNDRNIYRPKILFEEFQENNPFILKNGVYPGYWTGDHQIRLCHLRKIAIVMTNSSKSVYCFKYDDLSDSTNPGFSLMYKVDYTRFLLNDISNTLTLAVTRNYFLLADNVKIVIIDISTGYKINVLEMYGHAFQFGRTTSDDDDYGLGFLLMNESEILTLYFMPHYFPDTFDLYKFW